VAQKFHFAILLEVTRASHGLSAIAELLVYAAVIWNIGNVT